MNISEDELAQALHMMVLSPEDVSLISPPLSAVRPVPSFGSYQPGPPAREVAAPNPWQPRAVLITGGRTIARGIFQAVRSQREEAGRWVTGALYQVTALALDGSATPLVYRREEHGWYSYSCHDRFPDGEIDITGFRRLIPEGDPS